MSTVADLWNLQTTDLAVAAVKQRIGEIQDQLGETAELREARQEVAQSESELTAWRKKQQSLENEVQDFSSRIETAERDLMSGRVRNPKELEGMEANVAALKRRRSALEDDILEAMDQVETCREQLALDSELLAEIETSWNGAQADLTDELTQKAGELKQLAEQLNKQWAAISPDDQALYRQLRGQKGGRAVAVMQHNSCQACGVSLATGNVQQVRARNERVFCPTCGRLLHYQTH
ncbi:MAG: hypothetical protein U9R25_16100 [Chloroflexota bacterium]|nr:hypothetical protein [Chloroflexota bacterium]